MNDVIMWSAISISLSIFCLAMVLMSIGGDIRRVADSLHRLNEQVEIETELEKRDDE